MAAIAERIRGAGNHPAVIEVKPKQLAAAGVLVANGRYIVERNAKHGLAGIAVFAIGFDFGQLARIQKTLNALGYNQRYAIRVGEYHPIYCSTFGEFDQPMVGNYPVNTPPREK